MAAFKQNLRRLGHWFKPKAKKSEDGRDQWPSRTSYVLASMGGAIGFGNLLRYPSQVFNNNGLQWFIPYLIAISMLAIPVLVLEIAIGQAHRGGSLLAYNCMNKRTRGVGLGMVMTGYIVCVYYVPMLSWVMKFFSNSFQSPLPWSENIEDFYWNRVVSNVGPVASESGTGFMQYPGTDLIGDTVGWTFFSWFVVWLCLFNGVAVTGRVVYFTMGLPIITTIILIGRGASLPNAGRGIKLYFGEFNGGQLASGGIWQAATGQVFYSTGIGFGYFTAYASYNSQFADAVQDSLIICLSNATFETLAAFAVFGVVGFIGLQPGGDPLGSFDLGFLTLPVGLAEMPGAPFWAVLFFFTLFLLGMSSAFVMLDALITTICDTDWGKKFSHVTVASVVTLASALLSLIYCTEFGYYLLDGVDTWTNNVALLFIVWAECVSSTTLYRWRDVVGQVGWTAYLAHNAGYIGGMIVGPTVGHCVSPETGAGAGFGVYIAGVMLSLMVSNTPDCTPPGFWSSNVWLSRFWWMGAYSGNQLRRDLNVTVATGKRWSLPVYWAPILRYIAPAILAIIYSFAYPAFYQVRNDPLQIFGFTIAHLIPMLVIVTYIVPRSLDVVVPRSRREEGDRQYAPQVILGNDDLRLVRGLEAAARDSTSSTDAEKEIPSPSKDETGLEQSGREDPMARKQRFLAIWVNLVVGR